MEQALSGWRCQKAAEDLERSVSSVGGLEASLKEAFGETEPDAVDTATRASFRTTLVSSLQSHTISFGEVLKVFSRLSADARGAIQKVLGWVAERLVSMLTSFAAHLGLQNWSVAVQIAPLPPGANFTFTLTFA